jgi:hypothetical protein
MSNEWLRSKAPWPAKVLLWLASAIATTLIAYIIATSITGQIDGERTIIIGIVTIGIIRLFVMPCAGWILKKIRNR